MPPALAPSSRGTPPRTKWGWGRAPAPHRHLVALAITLALLLSSPACTPAQDPGFGPGSDGTDTDIETDDRLTWLEDHWTSTAEACRLPHPFIAPYTIESFWEDACQESLAADLGLDQESFSSQAGGALAAQWLLEGAFYLLGADLGPVEELYELNDDTDLWAIREPYIELVGLVADETDQDEVRPAVYNLVTSTIQRSTYTPGEDYGIAISRSTRTLMWNFGYLDNDYDSLFMTQMAAHAWLDVGHVACPEGHMVEGVDYSGSDSCDPDWSWTFGITAATARLMYNHVPVEEPDIVVIQKHIQRVMDSAGAMILED